MSFLFPGSNISGLGGKGAALAKLGEAGFEVPAWFAVPPAATWDNGELDAAIATLGDGPFAVRSSATMEDGAGHSFAGQFETFLEVPVHEVAAKISGVSCVRDRMPRMWTPFTASRSAAASSALGSRSRLE